MEELEFDYDIETFEDILYCPKLKKLVFGKNRYLDVRNVTEYAKSKISGDQAKSTQVLNKANESDILGLTIDYYGNRPTFIPYFDRELPYMTHLGYSQLPVMDIIGKEAFKEYEDGNRILCTPKDSYAVLDNLLDDNTESSWATTASSSMRRYEMEMDYWRQPRSVGLRLHNLSITGGILMGR